MESPVAIAPTSFRLPDWVQSRGRGQSAADAAFTAGAALKALDDLVRSDPAWAGCWRARQGLKCAVAAVRHMGRGEEAAALRDAVLLIPPGGDPGPAGRVVIALRMLHAGKEAIDTATVRDLAAALALGWDERLAEVPAQVDEALQSGRALPFAIAGFIDSVSALRPDAEALAFVLADRLVAAKLKWARPVPLLMAERHGPAFRTGSGRGRVRPGEEAFGRAVALALVEGAAAALMAADELSRRAAALLAVAPKLRTKGGGTVIRRLLDEDAVAASVPGSGLSRWASARMFERLEGFGAIRELSGRTSFRIYGL